MHIIVVIVSVSLLLFFPWRGYSYMDMGCALFIASGFYPHAVAGGA
jgi:hypothetical protein